MSLAFLTPESALPRQVHMRTPMERLALQAGARLSRTDGWNVPNAYGEPLIERGRLTETVGFVDRSSLAKLELQAAPAVLAALVARATATGSADGLKLQPGLAGRSGPVGPAAAWWCPVTPSRVLVLSEPGAGAVVRAALAQAADELQETVTIVDVTCGLGALSLIGPAARELLARFCAIDVRAAVAPPASFRPGSVARTPGYVLVEGEDRLLALVGWALGEYFWEVVADAAESLGGGPVGAEALRRHLESIDA